MATSLHKRKEVVGMMNTYQAISLMIMFGMFVISLISLIVSLKDNIKRKK
ncbi:putative holin-like toxin [Acidilutibacter cellobiosedens]|uniref:Putative holin-like toxin n=1 Tax=Acidilutibacter cellobiosedens TaxID=2507161 RepID=A0A410QGY3_9FIRM|nr:putative holin-like toxin [Acidilutibacter cellobiosedens]